MTKLVVLFNHWSSLIRYEDECFPSNVGLSKSKMIISATLGLGKNCPHRYLTNLFNILLKLHLINIYNIAKFYFSFLLEKVISSK